jgi:hypothetical protein
LVHRTIHLHLASIGASETLNAMANKAFSAVAEHQAVHHR